MEKLDLKNIVLLTVNCVNPKTDGVNVLKYCQKHAEFKKVILVSHEDIDEPGILSLKISNRLKNVDEYNDFILRAYNWIFDQLDEGDFLMVAQDDGYPVNWKMWSPDFLKYDYLGAPWPAHEEWVSRQTKVNHAMIGNWNRVGNGGFSLRSRRFVKLSATWDSCGGLGEDIFLCLMKFEDMLKAGIRFAPLDVALRFSYENPIAEHDFKPYHDMKSHFGFHGHQLNNSAELIQIKNKI